MFGKLFDAAIRTVTLPVAVVADVVDPIKRAVTGEDAPDETHTGAQVRKIGEDLEDAADEI